MDQPANGFTIVQTEIRSKETNEEYRRVAGFINSLSFIHPHTSAGWSDPVDTLLHLQLMILSGAASGHQRLD